MDNNIRNLQAKKEKEISAMRAIVDAAAKDNARELTDDEDQKFNAHQVEVTKLNAAIKREETLSSHERELGDRNAREGKRGNDADAEASMQDDTKGGFKSFGEFAQKVRGAAGGSGRIDQRLVFGAAPGTFGNEATGQDGGFLVPPAFASEIFTLSLEDDAILPLTDQVMISGNSMVFPKDETTPWGTDGVRAYWQAEASTASPTKPVVTTQGMRLHKLMSLVPVTDELQEDATALGSYLQPLMARSIGWKTSESLCYGTGVGQPYGAFTNTNIAVVVAKDSGQAANTVSFMNIANMIARLPPGSFPKARWFITPDAIPFIFGLTIGNYPIYLPPGGATGNPYGTLMGRPIQVSQHAKAFSSQGDLSLADFSYMRTIQKTGGIKVDSSMHLYFDADLMAYRAIFRIDGQPKISKQITQANGTNKLSPFVLLQAR